MRSLELLFSLPGIIIPTAADITVDPTGFLFCDGRAVSRTTYAALFAAIGTKFGTGDGSTTFNIPDLRGRVMAYRDDMGGSAANRLTNAASGIVGTTLGAAGGSETHVLTEAQLPAHRHFAVNTDDSADNTPDTNASESVAASNNPGSDWKYDIDMTATEPTVGRTSATGSGDAHPNVQPTLVLNALIKT